MAVIEQARVSLLDRLFLLGRLFLVVFAANMAVLILQVAAVRQLAPLVGCSLDTWTAIIGMFLAGICLGNWCGGWVADRFPHMGTLFVLLLLAAVGALSTLALTALFHLLPFLAVLPLYVRLAIIAAAICFPTSFLLSMITPLAIRLGLPDVRKTGRIVGVVYALGTLGSLVGNYLTGFYLLAYFGITTIVVMTACCLAGLSLFVLSLFVLTSWGRSRATGSKREPDADSPEPGSPAKEAAQLEEHVMVQETRLRQEDTTAHAVEPVAVRERVHQGQADRLVLALTAGAARWRKESPVVAQLRRWSQLSGNVILGCLVVGLTSFCAMALELAAPRMLAPEIGISVYSFTVIVGVCLAGVALGNLLGGLFADSLPKFLSRQMVLSVCLLLGGAATLGVLFGFHYIQKNGAHLAQDIANYIKDWPTSLARDLFVQRMLLWASIFFLPMLLLGTVSPQVIRLVLRDVRQSGRVAGRVYAISCFGALVGVFATGWWLISMFGVQRVVFLCGCVLLALALLLALLHGLAELTVRVRNLPAVALTYGLTLLGFFSYGGWLIVTTLPSVTGDSEYRRETNYYTLQLSPGWDEYHGEVVNLALDSLIHSMADPDDPSFLGYDHEDVQAEIARWLSEKNPDPHMLIIGGGGYTLPRYVEKELPEYSVEVVEIDPGVTKAAHDWMGLPLDTKVKTWNMDGRQFVTSWARRQHYSLVIQDAVNDLSVPFHLMTKEYNDAINEILTDDGVYLLTVIDDYYQGELMRASIRTLKETFPEVHLLETHGPTDDDGKVWQTWDAPWTRSVYVIYASRRPLRMNEIRSALLIPQKGYMRTVVLEEPGLRDFLSKGRQIILTDDYAPVDNLMSELFRER